jgi:hypothetical protein
VGVRNFIPLTVPNTFYLFLALISMQLRYMLHVFAHQISLSPVERNIYSMLLSVFRSERRNYSIGKNWFKLRKERSFILTRLHKEKNVRAITLIVMNKTLNKTWMAEIRSHESYILVSTAAFISGLKITQYTLRVSFGLLVVIIIIIIILIWNLFNYPFSK